MNTYPLRNKDNRTFAFEIENIYIGINKVAVLLRSAPNVADIGVRKLFSPVQDIHIEFTYMGTAFIVWEPFGDNSRYWIGPKDKEHSQINVSALESFFNNTNHLY